MENFYANLQTTAYFDENDSNDDFCGLTLNLFFTILYVSRVRF